MQRADRHERNVSAVEPGDLRASSHEIRKTDCTHGRAGSGCPSLILRDWALASSGLLDRADRRAPGLSLSTRRDLGGPRDHQGTGLHLSASSGRISIAAASIHSGAGRSARRICSMPRTARRAACESTTTSTPLHALTTLNDPTWVEAAQISCSGEHEGSHFHRRPADITRFERVVCRKPTERDRKILRTPMKRRRRSTEGYRKCRALLEGRAGRGETRSLDISEHAALSAVCLAIFNLDESLSRE